MFLLELGGPFVEVLQLGNLPEHIVDSWHYSHETSGGGGYLGEKTTTTDESAVRGDTGPHDISDVVT